MKKAFYLFVLLAIMLVAFGFFKSESSQRSSSCILTAKEFIEFEKSDDIIIDVRTKREFDEGHVQGAILIDVNDSKFKENINDLDKKKKYYVYCRSGSRSSRAIGIMEESGITNTCNIEGGIRALEEAGVQLIK